MPPDQVAQPRLSSMKMALLFASLGDQGHRGPPNTVDPRIVFMPFLRVREYVDFNGDGLPDLVQGWDAEVAQARGLTRRDPGTIKVGPDQRLA